VVWPVHNCPDHDAEQLSLNAVRSSDGRSRNSNDRPPNSSSAGAYPAGGFAVLPHPMSTMISPRPDVIASVHLFAKDEVGPGDRARQTPTPENRFGCPLEYQGEMFDCWLLLDESGPIAPGGTVTVAIVFLNPSLIKPRLRVSNRFRLWEMGYIGEGEVMRVF